MATDDERREVARRLRELVPCLFDDGEYIDCGEVESALGLVCDDGAWYEAEGVMRLADLIEPGSSATPPRRVTDASATVGASQMEQLLALADEMEYDADAENAAKCDPMLGSIARMQVKYANRIRVALGASDGR